MKKTLTSFVIAALTIATASCMHASDDVVISVSDLPQTAQTTINKHFSGKKIAVAKKDKDLFDIDYEVIFTDADKIEFDSKGNWTDIECKNSSVPAALVPAEITSYVATNYPNAKIIELEKERKKYDVKLNNGFELEFNTKFEVIKIELDD